MSNAYVVRGLPQSIALDGWWLTQSTNAQEASGKSTSAPHVSSKARKSLRKWHGLLLLILLGDFLLWGFEPALAFVVFAGCIFAVVANALAPWRDVGKPALLLLISALPMLEYAQPLSFGFLLAGLLGALVWLNVSQSDCRDLWPASLLKLVMGLPFGGLKALFSHCRKLQNWSGSGASAFSGDFRLFLRNWTFPIGGALLLGTLLVGANPVIERSVVHLFAVDLDVLNATQRMMFWVGLGLLLWPLLTISPAAEPLDLVMPQNASAFGLNAGSVLRALFLFNLFLAVQSALDFSILLGGARLPNGMSYATYAHRGAYPLLATAMLAGAFALAARPFLSDHKPIKPLLLLWLIQNILLSLSAALRLDLYIAEYGLTYLRIYALIWMGLVTVGLMLVAFQVLRAKSSRWLFLRVAGLGLVTLFVCAFVNFAALIAANTLDRAAESAAAHRIDWRYLCDLGPTARQTVRQKLDEHTSVKLPGRFRACFKLRTLPQNWREWDFRTWRTTELLGESEHFPASEWHVAEP